MGKIRLGHVTNSSSSSFLIKLKNSDAKGVIKNVAELDAMFVRRYGWQDDTIEEILEESCYKSDYERYKRYLADGWQLLFDSISNDDYLSDLEGVVKKLGFELEWEDD